MKTTDFTKQPEVSQLIEDLKNEGVHEKLFSDVVDKENNQYVELVQEGGGVLGVALIGYTYVMEQMGLRFFSLAGTSAGSINSLLIASFGNISKPKSEELFKLLANKNLFDFVDGDSDAKDLVNAVVEKARRIKLVWKGMQVIDNIFDDLGLNPGNNFLEWLTGVMMDNDVETTEKLMTAFMHLPEGFSIRPGVDRDTEGLIPRLGIISADVTTGTKVEFPRMSPLYWEVPGETNPAVFVRASMSIPYFFEPLIIKDIPSGAGSAGNWDEMAGYMGVIPEKIYLVDGGIMSNFPIDIFHKRNTIPRLPTFGVKLGIDRVSPNKVTSPLNLFGSIFTSIRHLHDYDFILRNPDYKMLVQHIDIGEHDWLNFNLSDEAKIDLFRRGALAAGRFLRKFEWDEYKGVREKLKTQA